MIKATEFFEEGLLLVIKHYGGNHVDYAIVETSDAYHLWKFMTREQVWNRMIIRDNLEKIFYWLELSILDNPKIEE